jgi:glutathione peroxidase
MAPKRKYRKLKILIVVLLLLLALFFAYVEVANRNSKQMTYRQKILKAVYPVWMWWTNMRGKGTTKLTNSEKRPPVSFYTLSAIANDGSDIDFSAFKGKKILLVNTASDCGYTDQYEALQQLYAEHKDKLIVVGFPANDFKEQEKGSDEEIAKFCKANFGVTFPLVKKSVVINSPNQHPVFQWLTDPAKNGWNKKQPAWNFSKYIVDENGILTHYFGSSVSPLSSEVLKALE